MCLKPNYLLYDNLNDKWVYLGALKSEQSIKNLCSTLKIVPRNRPLKFETITYKYNSVLLEQCANYCYDKLEVLKYVDIKDLKQLILENKIILTSCNHCIQCLKQKQNRYSLKVSNQFKLSKYFYLFTITFTNEQIKTIIHKSNFNDKLDYSTYSSLSKKDIANVVRNLKKKMDNYYNVKVDFNYLIGSEYGSNTNRAHYHILLMFDRPIPGLTRKNVRGNHFESNILKSKQYNFYDLEPVEPDNQKVSYYITKYITKQDKYKDLENYNLYQERLIKYFVDRNIDTTDFRVPKNETIEYSTPLSLSAEQKIYYQWYINKYTKPITKQKPFIKQSRSLGIKHFVENDNYVGIAQNGQMNYYYKQKFFKKMEQELLVSSSNLEQIEREVKVIFYEQIYKPILEQRRKKALIKLFNPQNNSDNLRNKYSKWEKNDIF